MHLVVNVKKVNLIVDMLERLGLYSVSEINNGETKMATLTSEDQKQIVMLHIEAKILERNKQDSGVTCLTRRLLDDIYDYMHVENNLEGLEELLENLNYQVR